MHSCYVWDHKSLKEEDVITHKTHVKFLCHTSNVIAYQCHPLSHSGFGTTIEYNQFRWEYVRNYLLSTSLKWKISILLIPLVSSGLPLKLYKVPKSLRLSLFLFFNLKLVYRHINNIITCITMSGILPAFWCCFCMSYEMEISIDILITWLAFERRFDFLDLLLTMVLTV